MTREVKIEIGKCYDTPSGITYRVLEFKEVRTFYTRIRIESLNGKRPGFKRWENLGWFEENAVPSAVFNDRKPSPSAGAQEI